MYHAVSYAATYYSIANTNQAAGESTAVLTWVPAGCSATRLDVFSQQGATITVALRVGMPGAMADSALSCQVSTGKSCSAAGAVAVPAGGFMDVGITHADSNPVGVWTVVTCN
jgi:collagen type VII alpha